VSVVNGQNVKADYSSRVRQHQRRRRRQTGPTKLANIFNARPLSGPSAQRFDRGFIVTGTAEQTGDRPRQSVPSLPLPGKILDPVLELHDATGALIGSNDNWARVLKARRIANSGGCAGRSKRIGDLDEPRTGLDTQRSSAARTPNDRNGRGRSLRSRWRRGFEARQHSTRASVQDW